MNFPIIFSSPAEAVKAIYEMKQSNPSAIINVKCTHIRDDDIDWEVTTDMTFFYATKESSGQYFLLTWDCSNVIYHPSNENPTYVQFPISSITITSIQSVEPKLSYGDKVFIISEWRSGLLWREDDNWDEAIGTYTVMVYNTTHNSWLEVSSRDLIKLPDVIKQS